jgi:hypothetical protein
VCDVGGEVQGVALAQVMLVSLRAEGNCPVQQITTSSVPDEEAARADLRQCDTVVELGQQFRLDRGRPSSSCARDTLSGTWR